MTDDDPSSPQHPHVATAIRDAATPLDERGLMPLAEARRVLGETRVFRRGEPREIDGTMVFESDTTWAALLSLEDAAEFVKEAKRLSWEFHVRGTGNLAPLVRYGTAILPWLESRLRADGVLVNVPWCVVPCLLAIDSREGLALALATRAVHDLLPGQPALGRGPGAFAAPGEGESAPSGTRANADAVASDAPPRAFLTPTEGLDLARRWLADKPHGYGVLAELASGGDARAVALLRDRAQALGGVVFEALEAALGEARAAEVARELELSRTELPPAIRAVLEEAPVADVPRGPVWSIAQLDDAAREYTLTLWDNLNYTTAAMRVTGFASATGDVLTVESLESSPLQNESLRWRMCAYGPGATKGEASRALVDEEDLRDVELGERGEHCVNALTNHLTPGGDRDDGGAFVEGSVGRVVPAPFPFAYQELPVKRALSRAKPAPMRIVCRLPARFARLPGEVRKSLRHALGPLNVTVFRLCAEHAEEMWPDDAALLRAAGGPADGKRLFRFDLLAWPRAGEPASSSDDLVAITEALRTRRAITRLPSVPNTLPEHWLRFPDEIDDDAPDFDWGGDDLLEPVATDPPAGADPYWCEQLVRGWPHGVTLMHGPDWNGAGQAEQTVPYLLDSPVQAMHTHWPRRAACMFLRAVGGLRAKYGSKDPGAVKGMANDAIVGLGDARGIVRSLATHPFTVPAHAGVEVAWLLEALVGGPETVTLFADALGQVPAAWATDRPALAAAVFELGFVLRRIRKGRAASRRALASVFDPGRTNDVGRALDLVLHGRAGAERSARSELDYVHVEDDVAWAHARIVDPATAASPIDAVLYLPGGEALLDKWAPRLAGAADARWVATQLCVLHGDRALALVLRLYAERQDARDAVKKALRERAGAIDALRRLAAGPTADAAQELLEAIGA